MEIKNISSFKEVERALNFEITRQKTIQAASKMETRHWDDVRRVTVTLRVKEDEEGYRRVVRKSRGTARKCIINLEVCWR